MQLAYHLLHYPLFYQSAACGSLGLRSCSSHVLPRNISVHVVTYMRIGLGWYYCRPSVLLRIYVCTYILMSVKITRTVFAILFGVHVPEWTTTVWVEGSQYHLIDRKEEIEELERMVRQKEEPLPTATNLKGEPSR